MTLKNLREATRFNECYYSINREERNLSAILYSLLLKKENFETFLNLIGCKFIPIDKEVGVYYEYSFIRDLWETIKTLEINNNDMERLKKTFIMQHLGIQNNEKFSNMIIPQFNKYFGCPKGEHSNTIQSPANWSLKYFAENILDSNFFLKVCRFKWCFNAKPDIVIHTSKDEAICIETKYEYEEGAYPTKTHEKKEFKRRGLPYVKQTDIQKQLMLDILGLSTQFIFIIDEKARKPSVSYRILTWQKVFSEMDYEDYPYYIKERITSL